MLFICTPGSPDEAQVDFALGKQAGRQATYGWRQSAAGSEVDIFIMRLVTGGQVSFAIATGGDNSNNNNNSSGDNYNN